MSKNYYISAYATSPSAKKWHPENEQDYFSTLAKRPNIIGIEHPFYLLSEKYPLAWLKKNIPTHWNIILTTMPQMMESSRQNPFFGLASIREDGRKQAVLLLSEINKYALKLNKTFGRNVVKAVHLHSSPPSNNGELRGNKDSFHQSLTEVRTMDWEDIALNVEHCDAFSFHQPPDKGFLSLEDEIEAIKSAGNYGIILNWGRSAIETRSVEGALYHIQLCLNEKLLKGYFYSGCTDRENSAYGVWKDTHMPPNNNIIKSEYLPEGSLLDAKAIRSVEKLLKPYQDDLYYGIKVTDLAVTTDIARKSGLNIESIRAIELATTM